MRLTRIILLTFLCGGISAAALGAEAQPVQPRTVRFAVHEEDRSYRSFGEQRVPITIELSREPTDSDQVFLILERTFPGHLVVPMQPAATSGSWKITVLLDPAASRSAKRPQGYRIDASFARMQGTRLTRFLKRSVYITTGMGDDPCTSAQAERRSLSVSGAGFFSPDEVQAASPAVREEAVRETHLAGHHIPEGGAAYWWGVKERIAERWKRQQNRRGVRAPVGSAPQVHFRLYANGLAQAVYVQQSSGRRRVDDAALASVVESLPLPPFPPSLGRCYMDVRIDLDTGKRR